MNKKTHIIGALSALALFGMSTNAYAAFTVAVANTTIANEAAPASKLVVGGVTNTAYSTDFLLAANSAVTVALTGGAMFNADPMASAVGAGQLALNLAQPFPRASVAYTVQPAGGIAQGIPLGANILLNNISIPAGVADANIDLTVAEGAVVDSLAAQVIGAGPLPNGPIITMLPHFEFSAAPSNNVTDLATGNTTIGGAAVTAPGTFTITNNGIANTPGNDNFLLTVNGNLAGVAAITDNAGGFITSSLATGVNPLGGTVAGAFDIVGNVGHARLLGTVVGAAVVPVVVNYDGVTPIAEQSFTVTASHYIPGGALSLLSGVPAPSTALPVVNVANAGSHITLNRVGPASTIKITDNASIVGANAVVHYSVNDAAGVAVAPVAGALALPAALAANGTLKVTGAQLLATYPALLGGSLTIFTSAGDVLVTHRQSNVNGTTINGATTGSTGL